MTWCLDVFEVTASVTTYFEVCAVSSLITGNACSGWHCSCYISTLTAVFACAYATLGTIVVVKNNSCSNKNIYSGLTEAYS